ncbi:TPA: fimbrial biogenesis outer membrane usher protein, partial [Escherichia coli]|nr:fimbrial biogenesis outer membrane usher protein [Escherichia coli]
MKVLLKKSLLLVRIALLCPAFSWGAASPVPGHNNELSFNPDFLELSDGNNAKNIDLSYFMNASGAAPGEYTVDVIMNGKIVDSQIKIDFTEQDNELTARLTPQQLERWGIDTNKLSVSSPS